MLFDEIGVVVALNRRLRLQPRIVVVQDAADGEPYRIKRTLEYGKFRLNAAELFL